MISPFLNGISPFSRPHFVPGGGGFVPSDLGATCKLWAPVDATASGAVASWPNSGSAGSGENPVQATGLLQPTGVNSVLNGHRIVRYDGAGDFLQTAGPIATNSGTVFLVFTPSSFANGYTSLLSNEDSIQGDGWGYLFKSNQKTAFYWSNSGGSGPNYDGSGNATLVLSAPVIAAIRWDASSGNSYINGVLDGTFGGTSGSMTGGGLNLGTSFFINRLFNGDMGELVVCDTKLSDADMNQVGNYMAGWSAIPWTNI